MRYNLQKFEKPKSLCCVCDKRCFFKFKYPLPVWMSMCPFTINIGHASKDNQRADINELANFKSVTC